MNNTIKNNPTLENETYSELFKDFTRVSEASEVTVNGETKMQITSERIYCNGYLCSIKFFDNGELVREDIYSGKSEVVCSVNYNNGKVTGVYSPKTNQKSEY